MFLKVVVEGQCYLVVVGNVKAIDMQANDLRENNLIEIV
jgi:hypothetical protein